MASFTLSTRCCCRVDCLRDIFRQAQRSVDRQLIDDEAVTAKHVAKAIRDVRHQLPLAGTVDILHHHSRGDVIERFAHGVSYVAVSKQLSLDFMLNEPPGIDSPVSVTALFGDEQERAVASLRRQARSLEAKKFRCMRVDRTRSVGALPPPHFVFFLDDGRALAWFDESHPYVVHPSFADLCQMPGLGSALVHAA